MDDVIYRYDVVFNISIRHNGKATYLAKINGGYTAPYQRQVGPNKYQQDFTFESLEKAIRFIRMAFEEFCEEFEVVAFTCRLILKKAN